MPVKKGDKIKVDYTGKLDDGTVFDSSTHGDHSHPLEFVAGEGKVIKGFDDAVMGMEKGEEKEFKIDKKDAYGEHNPEAIKNIPKSALPPGQEPKPGMMLAMATPDGQQIPVKIKDVTETEIVLDANHPLAGKDLTFNIKIVDIESA